MKMKPTYHRIQDMTLAYRASIQVFTNPFGVASFGGRGGNTLHQNFHFTLKSFTKDPATSLEGKLFKWNMLKERTEWIAREASR